MASHKRVAEAPQWLNIENYSGLDQLTEVELYEQLLIRYALLNGKLDSDNRKRLIDATRSTGIAKLSSTNINDLPLPNKWVDEGLRTNTARLMTCEDVYNFVLSDEVKNACWAEGKTDLFTDNTFYYEALKPYDLYLAESQPAQNNNELHITINLNSSDQQIREDVERIISCARKKLNIAPGFKGTKPLHIHKWINQRVLPYLDISIWIDEKGLEVTDEVLIGWLYSEDPEGGYSARKLRGIRESADYLMSETTLRDFTYLTPDL